MPEEKKDELVHLTIDDMPVAVPPGTLVWAAAKQAGIEIPIYCYHPKMPPLGACRMCFVEIEKMPKPPQTACTTPVSEGMIVHTKTEKVQKARRGTLEFLLINHPLDCPICDKGGECDLQDFTLRYGPGGTRFDQFKRHYTKPVPISEEISIDRERCILCQRCTRFSSEISMDNGLVMVSRGYKMEVGTAPDRAFDSAFSGNTVEICPVGALTASSYRFKARPWELKRVPGVCNNCSVGCNARIDVRVDKIMRLMSRENDEIDDGWLCNRGRWDFEYVNSPQRLRTPLIRRSGQLEPATWEQAFFHIARRLNETLQMHGATGHWRHRLNPHHQRRVLSVPEAAARRARHTQHRSPSRLFPRPTRHTNRQAVDDDQQHRRDRAGIAHRAHRRRPLHAPTHPRPAYQKGHAAGRTHLRRQRARDRA